MMRTLRSAALATVVALLVFVDAPRASAQQVIISEYCPPTVTYYSAPSVAYYPSTVSYYWAPVVSYYAAPRVTYYAPATVTYYASPAVSYYSAPVMSTTTRYGLFGRRRVTTDYYYPAYIGP